MNNKTDYFYLIAKCALLDDTERRRDTTFSDMLRANRARNERNFYESLKNERRVKPWRRAFD